MIIPDEIMAILGALATFACLWTWSRLREPWMLPLGIAAFWQTFYYALLLADPQLTANLSFRVSLYRPSIALMYLSLVAHGLREQIEDAMRAWRHMLGG